MESPCNGLVESGFFRVISSAVSESSVRSAGGRFPPDPKQEVELIGEKLFQAFSDRPLLFLAVPAGSLFALGRGFVPCVVSQHGKQC